MIAEIRQMYDLDERHAEAELYDSVTARGGRIELGVLDLGPPRGVEVSDDSLHDVLSRRPAS